MYLSPWNLHKETICEPEELEVEKLFSTNLHSEPFSEFSCLLPKNVPQPDRSVYRRDFNNECTIMEKILVADLLGTLVPDDPNLLNLLYGTRKNVNFLDISSETQEYWSSLTKNAINSMIEELKLFLSEGNELVIVTNLGHSLIEDTVDTYLKVLFSELFQYHNQIQVFFKGKDSDLQDKKLLIENGVKYIDIDGLKIGFVYEKANVFDYIKIDGKELYTIGNDCFNDSGMMLRCFDAKGSVALINYHLNEPITEDEDTVNYYIRTLASEKRGLGLCVFRQELESIRKSYKEGKISVLDMYKLLEVYGIISGYNVNRKFGNSDERGPEIMDPEYIKDFVSSTNAYSSFKDYNRRVLVKQPLVPRNTQNK